MGMKVKGGQSVYQKIGQAIDRATGSEQSKLGKSMVKSAVRISPSEYWAKGKYATGEYQKSWGMKKSGNSIKVGNTAAHALVIEFGSTGGSLRRSGKKRQRKHKGGGGARNVNLPPQKVLARAISMAFDATESARKKRKSLDGKALK